MIITFRRYKGKKLCSSLVEMKEREMGGGKKRERGKGSKEASICVDNAKDRPTADSPRS